MPLNQKASFVKANFLLAAKLYELGRLSSGEAAALAGKSRVAFLFSLNQIGVPMSNLQMEDVKAELDLADMFAVSKSRISGQDRR